jgi:hypothetical protein
MSKAGRTKSLEIEPLLACTESMAGRHLVRVAGFCVPWPSGRAHRLTQRGCGRLQRPGSAARRVNADGSPLLRKVRFIAAAPRVGSIDTKQHRAELIQNTSPTKFQPSSRRLQHRNTTQVHTGFGERSQRRGERWTRRPHTRRIPSLFNALPKGSPKEVSRAGFASQYTCEQLREGSVCARKKLRRASDCKQLTDGAARVRSREASGCGSARRSWGARGPTPATAAACRVRHLPPSCRGR